MLKPIITRAASARVGSKRLLNEYLKALSEHPIGTERPWFWRLNHLKAEKDSAPSCPPILSKMGLDSVQSPHTRMQLRRGPRRPLHLLCQLTSLPARLMEWRAGMLCFGPGSLAQDIAQAVLIAQLLAALSDGIRSTLYPNAPADSRSLSDQCWGPRRI
jgi:hypothetical protein